MELLVLILMVAVLGAYVAYRERLSIAYRQWASELDLFNKRLAVYEQLKGAVGPLRASGSVSCVDTKRFAQAMSDMRFLFDKNVERFVSGIYDVLLKKHALDALIEKVAGQENVPTDRVLIEQAASKSQELASQITNGIYKELPELIERFMRPRPLLSPTVSLSAALQSSHPKRAELSRSP